jgi:hypothetical protein
VQANPFAKVFVPKMAAVIFAKATILFWSGLEKSHS